MLTLCYSALSPFCRKVRMAMEWKGLAFDAFESCDIHKYPAFNPRAEIPILIDGATTVVNSADILAYLDRKHPEVELYPRDAGAFALVREWERTADTLVDAVVTDVAIFQWAQLPPPPDGLIAAAHRELSGVYDRLEARLTRGAFAAGALSVADFALYPHLAAAHLLGLRADPGRHPSIAGWLKRVRATPEGQSDLALVRAWWADRPNQDVDTQRINWGTHRLEWFLANGFLDRFVQEVHGDRVLWSVGPDTNARNSPLAVAV